MTTEKTLDKQIEFILEIDKVKQVFRRTYLLDESRKENDAEHSWHLATMAVLLHQYAAEPVDLLRVIKMALIHDLVEIDAGDIFLYDDLFNADKAERETKAAERIFNILPSDQAAEVRALWDEFEARQSPEAKFAAALDRLQPLLHNLNTHGKTWREYGITVDRVIAKNKHVAENAPELWRYVEAKIYEAVEKGYLGKAPESEQTDVS